MSRPWMPLYVGDYLADTRHLTTEEHGAYMLLIMHYWRTGGLPNDDARLARIAGLTPEGWSGSRTTLADLFEEGWKHKRVDAELAEAERLSNAGRAGGLASGKARQRTAVERPLNGLATIGQAPHSPSQPQESNLSSGVKGKRWTPPRHGATSTVKGRVYVERGTPEWEAYAADFRATHKIDPDANEHGGKWFRTMGEG